MQYTHSNGKRYEFTATDPTYDDRDWLDIHYYGLKDGSTTKRKHATPDERAAMTEMLWRRTQGVSENDRYHYWKRMGYDTEYRELTREPDSGILVDIHS